MAYVLNESEKLKKLLIENQHSILGCPINKKTKTKISEESLRKMCLKFQTGCGNIGEGSKKRSLNTMTGFARNAYLTCSNCSIAKAVEEGKSIDYEKLPFGIEITSMEELGIAKYKEKIFKKQINKKIAMKIKQMKKEGVEDKEVFDSFGNIDEVEIANVINGITWVGIK
jgi:hypothetical protein